MDGRTDVLKTCKTNIFRPTANLVDDANSWSVTPLLYVQRQLDLPQKVGVTPTILFHIIVANSHCCGKQKYCEVSTIASQRHAKPKTALGVKNSHHAKLVFSEHSPKCISKVEFGFPRKLEKPLISDNSLGMLKTTQKSFSEEQFSWAGKYSRNSCQQLLFWV